MCVYTGVRLSTVQALPTPNWRYLVGVGKDSDGRRVWVDGRPTPHVLARFVNHHFDAWRRNIRRNVRPDDGMWVMTASRPIAAGYELYCAYGPFYWHIVDRDRLPVAEGTVAREPSGH